MTKGSRKGEAACHELASHFWTQLTAGTTLRAAQFRHRKMSTAHTTGPLIVRRRRERLASQTVSYITFAQALALLIILLRLFLKGFIASGLERRGRRDSVISSGNGKFNGVTTLIKLWHHAFPSPPPAFHLSRKRTVFVYFRFSCLFFPQLLTWLPIINKKCFCCCSYC